MTGYLDNSATTQPCEACVEAVTDALTVHFGNPSSLHGEGLAAHKILEAARETVAQSIGAADKGEIYFTSGGTEANNLALFGAAYAARRKGNRIVTTAIEHESVLEAAAQLEKDGFEVIRLMPDAFGHIDPAQIAAAVDENTILISMMAVNNEVGSYLPVDTLRRIVKRNNAPALIHIDAVQAYGKIPIRVQKLGADLLTVTAHKIHGPKGVGAFYVKKGTRLQPRTFGGEQERKVRPGTESLPLIAGFAAAVHALPELKQAEAQIRSLSNRMKQQVAEWPGILINSPEDGSPYICNLAVAGIRSQTLIQFLSGKGICVSNGSACAKGKRSHVLTAMGLEQDRIDSSIRISFSRMNTEEDITLFLEALEAGMQSLVHK